ncbi:MULTISPECIES: ribosome biogenesis GTP-binding protein YihA/YsxC [Caloramator]|uniref:Probable GTP-binding protein EngB n=1 Tax=Caloramator australicus RC3 TaxID=857293 RepID=I7LHA4_9CLOT|nr:MULTISPECIES: ribosome biogenesis GTP-binding protein YihA/YsxC [Caloramator]MDO6355183.1 ribosome biogenesis GTP-binding protein YihA/YsxC [Caloramator sp. CAR-1]CCJ33886.1 GTP-binding protein EngB [Caloramator australicus RC3]
MKIKKAELEKVAVFPYQYPNTGRPEIALAGRSNVGKSSLINTLVNIKSLARTSSSPGKTRTINFFNINDSFYLVDLPGYGYAKVSKEEKKKWGKMIEDYLNGREELKLIALLVDSRHAPTEDDKLMLNFIRHSGKKLVVIATKIDKLSRSELIKNINMLKRELQLTDQDYFIPFSSLKKIGKEELWKVFEENL